MSIYFMHYLNFLLSCMLSQKVDFSWHQLVFRKMSGRKNYELMVDLRYLLCMHNYSKLLIMQICFGHEELETAQNEKCDFSSYHNPRFGC